MLEDLSQLKAQMRWLVGNGHPGKLKELEERVERHEQFVNRVGGITAFVASSAARASQDDICCELVEFERTTNWLTG